MDLRFVTRNIHAYLDYPVAISLMLAPIILGLGTSNPVAWWLAFLTGIAAFTLTLLTNHHLGIVKVIPYSWHLAVDFTVGALFIMAPAIFGFEGLDAWYYWANGAAVLTVISLHKPEVEQSHQALQG